MALKGIKVVELAGLAPAPFCGMVLADFGASVINVDKVGSHANLDVLRNGKQSLALNLKTTEGLTILRRLCKQSDVLLEPFRAGVMESLGLGPDVLLADNPRLVYARLTGFGQKGLYSKRAGHDINYLAMSGLLSLFGRKGEKPMFPSNLAADFGGGGLTCALGILLALFERTSSGKGQVVDCSMVEGASYLGSWLYRSQRLPIWTGERGTGLLDSGSYFYEVYETKDGKYLSVGALEPQFYKELLRGLDITEDELPQFSDSDEGKKILTAKFKEKSREEWMQIFNCVDACVLPVLGLEEALEHPHNAERNSFTRTKEGIVPNPAPNLSRTPGVSKGKQSPPHTGEHTLSILRGLGYSDADIAQLEKDNVVECSKKAKL